MSYTSLTEYLTELDIPLDSRFSLETTGTILGLTPKQVRSQIKKGNLVAVRGSRRQWTGVMFPDLADYFLKINGVSRG